MGIRERQERDREAVRRAILDAARELFMSEGFQNVSIRKVAERIEYSPAAIYGYFPCKDDIFFALAEEGFHLLGGADPSRRAHLDSLPPLDAVRESFWRVYEFSRDHSQYFALMFVDRDVPRISREYERFAFVRDMKHEIVGRIQRCIDERALASTLDATVVCRLLMMAVLGVAAMRLSGRLGTNEQADLLAQDVLNTLIQGLKSGAALQSMGAACMAERQQSEPVPVEAGKVS
jgi:AcrR family transcriptional regulator